MLDATPLLKLYARRRLARLVRQDPAEAQRRTLRRLIRRARDTRFGRDHGFDRIGDVAGFQDRVPLRDYEDFWHDYWRDGFPVLDDRSWPGRVPYFAVTSGTTTGVTKFIPCTAAMVRANRRATLDLLSYHVAARPRTRLLAGCGLMLGGSTGLVEIAPGVRRGDLSGIAAREVPWWARPRTFPPDEIALIEDWEEKIDRLAAAALDADIRAISGTPSWLLILFDRLAALRPGVGRELVHFFPDLELLVHGGVNFAPYRSRFRALLAGGHAELREVYAASEGFIAVADRGDGEGLRPLLDNGLFLEFVPVDELTSPRPTRHWIADAETGVNYAIVVTTCGGQWAYVLGDTVELIGRDPPRLLVTGRISYMLSAFGEHLIAAEIEDAVSGAARAIAAEITDYSVGAVFPEGEGARGGHLYVVEFAGEAPQEDRLAAFAAALDRSLCAANEDYAAHRAGGYGMGPPAVHAVEPGTFAAWMKRRGQLGGQHKVPRVITDPDLFGDLKAFAGR